MSDNILYEAIGVDRNASNQQINQGYLKSIQENQGNSEKIELINISYQILTNPKFRHIYDCEGIEGLNSINLNNEDDNNQQIIDDFYAKENEKKAEIEIDNILYETLKVNRNATLSDIQDAYELEYIHITSSVESLMDIELAKIQLLNAAYNVLSNSELRKIYDKSGIAGVNKFQEEIQEKEKSTQKFSDDFLYEILGVSRFADDEDIRSSYLSLLKSADYNDKERIKMIHSAYSVLSVQKIRKVYDMEGIEGINRNFKSIHIDPNLMHKKSEMKKSDIVTNENYGNLLYETLEIQRDATDEQIKFSYCQKMRKIQKCYGFIDDDSQEVQLIKASFNVLSNPELRAVYDKSGIEGINKLQSEENDGANREEPTNSNSSTNNTNSNSSTNKTSTDSNTNNTNSNSNTKNMNSDSNTSNANSISNTNNTNSNSDTNNTNTDSNTNNSNSNSNNDNILYEAVGVSRDASFIQIQMSFLKKLNETINDESSEASQLLHAAYNVLSDPNLRKIYDEGGLGAINKVYEERAKQEQADKPKEEEKESAPVSEDVFITQSKREPSFLKEFDSDDEHLSKESRPNKFQLFKDEDNEDLFHIISDDDDINDGISSSEESNNEEANEEDSSEAEIFDVELTLEQLYNGCQITKSVQLDVFCPHCKGTGNEYCQPFPKCPECNGSGQKMVSIEKPSNFFNSDTLNSAEPNEKQKIAMKRVCEKCFGRGELRDEYAVCCVCYGLKKFKSDFQFDLEIKPGTNDGEIIKIKKEDKMVSFKVVQKKHPLFERIGNNLSYVKKINLTQSLCGNFAFLIETLDKRKLVVKNQTENSVIEPNSKFVIKNEGFPIKSDSKNSFWKLKKGDLIVKFEVEIPSVLTLGPKVVKMLKEIQPLPNVQMNYDRSVIIKDKLYFYQLPYEYA